VIGGANALPIMIPPVGEAQLALLDRIEGLLVPGSPSNVHPSHYGADRSLTPDRHDPARDATTLPLIRAAIARGLPVLAICRGIQELNVALGEACCRIFTICQAGWTIAAGRGRWTYDTARNMRSR